jgi:integrase
MRRARYQQGTITRKERKGGPDVWVFRYIQDGVRKSVILGTVEQLTKSAASKAAERWRIVANPDNPVVRGMSFGGLLDLYEKDELPLLEWPTQKGYRSYIRNYIRVKWADYAIGDVKTFAVERWLNGLADLAPKSKGHIKTVMQSLFNCAMRWEFIPVTQNPMVLVRIPGVSKRKKKPRVLTVGQFWDLYGKIEHEETKLISLLAISLGLSVSEACGLKWGDIDLPSKSLFIQRKAVQGHVGKTKTETRFAELPMDDQLSEMVATYKLGRRLRGDENWVFPAPRNPGKPVTGWNLQQLYLRPAAIAAGLGDGLGFHSLRHTYSSMLRNLGVDVKVQQELMRHADARTTMNIYTQSIGEAQRAAQSLVTRSLMTGRVN